MKQTRISKKAKAPAAGGPVRWIDDPRDADVVRAKALSLTRAGSREEASRIRAA